MRKIMMVLLALLVSGCVPAMVGMTRNASKLYGAQGAYNRPDYVVTVNSSIQDTCAATEIALKKLDIQIQEKQENDGEITIRGSTSKQKIQIVLRELTRATTRIEIKTTDRDSQLSSLIADEIKN